MSISMRRDRRGTLTDALILRPVLSVVLPAVVAKAALLTGAFYVLFPEVLAACRSAQRHRSMANPVSPAGYDRIRDLHQRQRPSVGEAAATAING
jgi:hypothetical protein